MYSINRSLVEYLVSIILYLKHVYLSRLSPLTKLVYWSIFCNLIMKIWLLSFNLAQFHFITELFIINISILPQMNNWMPYWDAFTSLLFYFILKIYLIFILMICFCRISVFAFIVNFFSFFLANEHFNSSQLYVRYRI